ncbi:hypothetical protein Droror1_Dr00023884 [Drosera rotundifolia]
MAARKTNFKEDRISSLPDEILASILSYLPTKQAVAMSILSRRWKLLHALTDVLVLEGPFPRGCMDIVNKIMMQRGETPLRRLSLRINCSSRWHSNAWLEPLSFYALQEFEMAFDYVLPNVPLQLWEHKHLVTLKLSRNGIYMPMRYPELVCLPRLRSHHLRGMHDMGADFINSIFTNSLEDLTLSQCLSLEPGVFRFCGKALKSFDFGQDQVVEASIELDWANNYNAVFNMLCVVVNVKVLHLGGFCLKILEEYKLLGCRFELPDFSHLSRFALPDMSRYNPGIMFWEMLISSPSAGNCHVPKWNRSDTTFS